MQSSRLPLYHQIYLILRERILANAYPVGGALPGEVAIAEDFKVSRITSRRALDELAAEGLVERKQGRGTLVMKRPAIDSVDVSMDSLVQSNTAIGSTRVETIAIDMVKASNVLPRLLDVPDDAEILRIERLRFLEEEPFCHVVSHVQADLGNGITPETLSKTMLVDILARNGAPIAAANQSITATLAWPDIAAKLRTKTGAPLLRLTRVAFDATGRPIEGVEAHFRPDLYSFDMRVREPTIDVGESRHRSPSLGT